MPRHRSSATGRGRTTKKKKVEDTDTEEDTKLPTVSVCVVILGGSGFVGQAIAESFLSLHNTEHDTPLAFHASDLVLADIFPPPSSSPLARNPRTHYRHCDVTNSSSVNTLLQECKSGTTLHTHAPPTPPVGSTVRQRRRVLVIHLASQGMSGAAMLDPHTEIANVAGAQYAVEACRANGVEALVYASTYNVCFGGKEIIAGNASTPHYPYEQHTDYYSRSKALAETLVLRACGTSSSSGSSAKSGARGKPLPLPLQTCVLRPAAIYGEGEMRHFPRIVSHMDCGLFAFRIGNATVDWVHVTNLAQAFVKVSLQMLRATDSSSSDGYGGGRSRSRSRSRSSSIPARTCACAGKAYSISDGTPVDSFGFLRPLCEARGIAYPELVLPVWAAIAVAYMLETLHVCLRALLGKNLAPPPFLTRAEVYKVGVSHWFSLREARRDFGYAPTITTEEGARRMADHYRLKKEI